MAEDEDKKDNINVDDEEGESASATPQKKGGLLSPFLIKILSIVALVIGMFVVSFVVAIIVFRAGKPTSGGAGAPEVENIKRAEVEHYEHMKIEDSFRQQLSDGKMIQLKIALGFKGKDKRLVAELGSITPEIRDIVIRQLTKLNSEYFAEDNALEKLEEDLLKQINRIVNNGKIEKIYFEEFTLM
jgi:flagellar basal body-associated protein FliL